MVVARSIFKNAASKHILRDISLSLDGGEIAYLLGPNGAGKSTLIRMLLGLMEPTSGSIRLFGLDPWKDGSRVRARCGFVPEDDLFYGDETALSNLLLWAGLHGLKRSQALPAIESLSYRLGITDELEEKVATYSKGMKRRLSLVRAFMTQADLLLLDEPMSGLDINARTELRNLISDRVRRSGCGAIISSHDLEEVSRLEPYVKIMVRGEIVDEMHSDDAVEVEAAYWGALWPASGDWMPPMDP